MRLISKEDTCHFSHHLKVNVKVVQFWWNLTWCLN